MTIESNQTVIAGGGPDDYLEARHVMLRGTTVRPAGRSASNPDGTDRRSPYDSFKLAS